MRQSLFFISVLLVSCAQPEQTKSAIVIEESTWISGIYYDSTRDTLTLTTGDPDLNFFRKYFNILYRLPDTLTKTQYKSSTLKIWGLENKKTDFTSNWIDTYIYDDKGRLKYFSYSSCVICSQLPFEYNIVYKHTGEIEKIFDNRYSNESYQFYYGKNFIIEKIEYFEHGKLSKRITRII